MVEKKLNARLEVRLRAEQLEKLQKEAQEKNISLGSLVREAIDFRYQATMANKLRAVEELAKMSAPVSSWEQMKREIEDVDQE